MGRERRTTFTKHSLSEGLITPQMFEHGNISRSDSTKRGIITSPFTLCCTYRYIFTLECTHTLHPAWKNRQGHARKSEGTRVAGLSCAHSVYQLLAATTLHQSTLQTLSNQPGVGLSDGFTTMLNQYVGLSAFFSSLQGIESGLLIYFQIYYPSSNHIT